MEQSAKMTHSDLFLWAATVMLFMKYSPSTRVGREPVASAILLSDEEVRYPQP